MDAFALANLACGILVLVIGALVIIRRERVFTFVRRRFEDVYREQQVSEQDATANLPKMSAVIIVGLGFVVFGGAQIAFAVLSFY